MTVMDLDPGERQSTLGSFGSLVFDLITAVAHPEALQNDLCLLSLMGLHSELVVAAAAAARLAFDLSRTTC